MENKKYLDVHTDTNIHRYNNGAIEQSPVKAVKTVEWDKEHKNICNGIPCYDYSRDRLMELLFHKYGIANSLKSRVSDDKRFWVRPLTEMFQYTRKNDDTMLCTRYIKSWNFQTWNDSSTLQILRLVEDLHLTRDVDSKSPGFCLDYVKTGSDKFQFAVNDKWGVTNQYGETLSEDRRLISNIYDISIYFDYWWNKTDKWTHRSSVNLPIQCAIRFHKPGNTQKSCDWDYSYWHFPVKYHTPYDRYYGKITPIRNN
jgi:hypothetical protein